MKKPEKAFRKAAKDFSTACLMRGLDSTMREDSELAHFAGLQKIQLVHGRIYKKSMERIHSSVARAKFFELMSHQVPSLKGPEINNYVYHATRTFLESAKYMHNVNELNNKLAHGSLSGSGYAQKMRRANAGLQRLLASLEPVRRKTEKFVESNPHYKRLEKAQLN